ncbi:putative lysine-specific demethylase JMJ16 isoform X1 [Spinacia oleracea]|uniref:Lysine-specific demethylase JMJ16 isoform X1 n=1 Tax=Spinacia oleracea TaxID=3562 RepID=A0ABM3RBL9_SPIOL|nr:putative lysine-specific demethylase JMJ16 isoform X1 [Spinacia oleracea]XP_056693016.1 putative lysine-specific demethylase JMJ16 isoform X1 [Spinacia oleracea]
MAIYSFSCRLCWTSTQVSSMYIIKEPEGGDYGDPDNFIGKKRSCWIACKELRFRSRILLSSRLFEGLVLRILQEFKDTIKYVEKIYPQAELCGYFCIIPSSLWKPSCPLKEKDIWEHTKFVTRVQRNDKLQNRNASRKQSKVRNHYRKNHNHSRKKRRRCGRMEVEFGPGNGKTLEPGKAEFGFEPSPEFTIDGFHRYADTFKAQYFRSEKCTDSGIENWEPSVNSILASG